MVKLLMPAIQLVTSETPGSLYRILQNIYTLYRNDCQITLGNWNCDIPIRFGTPACRMKDDPQIAAESQHNFYFLACFPPNLLDRSSPNFYTMYALVPLLSRSHTRRYCIPLHIVGGVGSVEERRSLADGLSLSCARPAADG